jgi:hypothetical protein
MNSCFQPSQAASSRKNVLKRLLPLIGVVALSLFVVNLLYDVECDDQDVTVNGWHVLQWAFPLRRSVVSNGSARTPLFTDGIASVEPTYIRQGLTADCNFLATVASFINLPGGREKLVHMIKPQTDGGYLVTFPGASVTPVKISALSPDELAYYASTRGKNGQSAGLWLPVLEKAYGEYRIEHQSLFEHAWRCLRHGVLEARWTSTPYYPGLGASFGARDNLAANLLTGHDVRVFATADFELGDYGLGKAYATPRQIISWFRRSKVLDAFLNEQNGSLLDVSSGKALATATTEQQSNCTSVGLRNKHAYSVTGYDCVSKQIYLYDPYGNTDYDSSDGKVVKRNGHFILTLQDFNRYFSHLNIEKLNPQVSLASI